MQFAQPQFAVRKSLQVSRTISPGAILDWGVRKMKTIIQLRSATRALSITTNHLFLIFFLCLALPALAAAQDPLAPSNMPSIDTTCTDYASNVWVTNSLYEVYQNTGTKDCTKWQQTFYGTQNEFVDFQVHFHDTGSGTSGFQVTVSSFVQTSPSSYTIAPEDSSHTDILVYKEAYINVTTTSLINASNTPTYLNIMQAAPGVATTGKIPDPLIPTIDPYFHQTTNAFPATVSASNNQSAWIDVHIPPAAPSGYYKGTVTVSSGCTGTYPGAGCTTIATIPIIIAVWQWPNAGHMPSTATLQTVHGLQDSICAGFAGGNGYDTNCGNSIPAAAGSASTAQTLIKQWMTVLYLDHRLEDFQPDGLSSVATYWTGSFNGTTNTCTGCANTILPGAKLNISGWNNDGGTQQQWMTQFHTNSWPLPNWYEGHDEPTTQGAWTTIYNDAVTAHSLTPSMQILSTTSFRSISEFSRMPTAAGQTAVCGTATCLTNSVDIIVSNVVDMINTEYANLSAYQTFLAGTSNIGTGPPRKWFSYEACDSTQCGAYTGSAAPFNLEGDNYTLDTTPISHRVINWFDMYAGQTGDLYFSEAICWYASGLTCGTNDPWASVDYGGTNGDGTLVYPGRTTSNTSGFSTGNLGISTPILVPSLRLKHLRDGSQDYEYMTILKAKGQGAAVTAAINSFMHTGAPSGTLDAWSFNNTQAPVAGVFTSDLPDARITLGTTLHQLSYSTGLMPPPTLSGTLQ